MCIFRCVSCCMISCCISLVVKWSGLSDAMFSMFVLSLLFIVFFLALLNFSLFFRLRYFFFCAFLCCCSFSCCVCFFGQFSIFSYCGVLRLYCVVVGLLVVRLFSLFWLVGSRCVALGRKELFLELFLMI